MATFSSVKATDIDCKMTYKVSYNSCIGLICVVKKVDGMVLIAKVLKG